MQKLPSFKGSSVGLPKNQMGKPLLHVVIVTFFVITFVAIATPAMSNEKAHNAVFGSFDSTGAAILLVGFPWLCLQYAKHYY